MIVLPDGKICRNLPEQVAENLKKIQEIINFLDGVNIQDNLVVIADLSQILTAAELEVVERPVAFIYYNAELYIKKNEAAGVAYFVNVFSIEDTGTQLNFNSNEMQVNLGTGALAYSTATATSYTKSQIDSLLALKANDNEVAKLAGAAFTGGITGPSIIEDMNGYSFSARTSVSATFDFRYVGVCKNGNKITFVIFLEITALADLTGNTNIYIGDFTIPSAVGEKLYPSLIGGQNVLSAFTVKQYSNYLNSATDGYVYFYKSNNTSIGCGMYTGTYSTGTKKVLRIEQTFLLSDNLAA